MRIDLNIKRGVLAGFLYGVSLTVIGVLLAAAGHGTYLLLGIASAPISLLGFVFSLVGPTFLWSAVGLLLPYTPMKPQRQVMVGLMLLHYTGLLFLPFFDEDTNWKYFEKVWMDNPGVVLLAGCFYLGGQVVIWQSWLRTGKESEPKLWVG